MTAGSGKKRLRSLYILRQTSVAFADGLDVGCERKRGVKNDAKVLDCATRKMAVAVMEMRKTTREEFAWGLGTQSRMSSVCDA